MQVSVSWCERVYLRNGSNKKLERFFFALLPFSECVYFRLRVGLEEEEPSMIGDADG